jgi:hypothetical protein
MDVLDLAKSEARFSAEMISKATTISLAVPTEAALLSALQVHQWSGVKGVAPTIASL